MSKLQPHRATTRPPIIGAAARRHRADSINRAFDEGLAAGVRLAAKAGVATEILREVGDPPIVVDDTVGEQVEQYLREMTEGPEMV